VSKNLIALILLAALSASASAETAKANSGHGRRQSPAMQQEMSDKAAKEKDRGETSDPYWTPCDYYSTRDPNGCGW
jgi:hypothetical protein